MSYIAHSSKDFSLHDSQPFSNHPALYAHAGHIPNTQPDYQRVYEPQPPLATPPPSSHSTAYATDHPPVVLPKVGQTRCYWSLLSSDLQFIYLDPVLACHLETQADLLVGKSLLAFVHPDERQTAKQDLGSVLDSKTLHGSVTRVRFARLSTVRRRLGYNGPPLSWTEADKIALDEDYMAVDIVINWAAEGLVLCFIHASVDLSPNDNNEQQKTEWTNWCETPSMTSEQIELLTSRLLVCIPQTGSMNRVFQILANEPDRRLLLSWPPGPHQSSEATSHDFAKLVESVNMAVGVPGANDAKTSCTRRYKALHNMPIFGGEVESIFIPHGCIIFACHKVSSNSHSAANSSTMQQLAFAPAPYNPQSGSAFYDQNNSYTLPPLTTQDSYGATYMSQATHGTQSSYSPQRWSQGTHFFNLHRRNLMSLCSAIPAAMSNLRSNSYTSSQTQDQSSWQPPPAHPQPSYLDTTSHISFNRPLSPSYTYSPTTTASTVTSPITDTVPPPRRRVSPTSAKEHTVSARSGSNRPAGILKCSSCKATSSPEWRKGPSGKKELCNACGLRFARSRAKKDGQTQGQRRRKEKPTIKREQDVLSGGNASASYPTIRRTHAEGSFSTGGPHPGSDIFSTSGHHSLDKMTPSPSPPSANVNFVHYAPSNDNRSSYSNTSYYGATPSPLANPPYSNQPTDAASLPPPQSGHQQITQLPPLGQLSAYAGRLSPLVPSPSPVANSSPSSAFPVSSYERDRERERDYQDLPPTPLSAEPRPLKRSFCNSTK
ncbi:hypothetical protein FA15DRAFT_86164 [Coprinopsis marcescibilis]|uniref:GATA-type domain-containing protein n=1 Tax=Coprinopsis marcescibilis TaxID=230819 RepID=A0A5C3L7P9_COPMA|nr:hypothetical protein FA15DRAFT_86164 [Coprinopsis marcescibilis]